MEPVAKGIMGNMALVLRNIGTDNASAVRYRRPIISDKVSFVYNNYTAI